jgi:hypothetical protein
MDKEHILKLYDDLNYFCQKGELKYTDPPLYSEELYVVVRNFVDDLKYANSNDALIIKDCTITSSDSDYSNFIYSALIMLFGHSDFDFDYISILYNRFISAAIEHEDELYQYGYGEYILDKMCIDHVFNGVVYNITILNTDSNIDSIKFTISSKLKANRRLAEFVNGIMPRCMNFDIYDLYDFTMCAISSLRRITRSDNKKMQFTYIGIDINNGLVKIGKSKDIRAREKALRVANVYFHMIAYVDKDIESILHSKYSVYNIDREWFHLRKDQVESIIKEHGFGIVENNKRYFDRIGDFR